MKVNLGCGRDIREGWVNVDQHPAPGVDLVANLDDPDKISLPWPDDSVTELHVSHLVEHLRYPLPLFEEMWRVAAPDAELVVRCPYGSSDDADEDPTHVRRLYMKSWGYLSQPFYWRADYGYRGDWQPETITLKVSNPAMKELSDDELHLMVLHWRNVVAEMVVTLRAIKPARPTEADLQRPPTVVFKRL